MPKIIAMLHSVASLRPVFFSYSCKSSLVRSHGKLCNALLKEDGGDQLNRSCEKRSIAENQRREEYPTYNKKKGADWIGHVLCKNFLLKYNFEGKIEIRIEVTGGRGRSLKQLQGYLNTLRTGSFKLFKRPFPGFLTILTL